MTGRAKIPPELYRLTKSQILIVIDESALGMENSIIAKRILIDRWAHADIAAELGYDRSAVSHRIPAIYERLIFIANKLNIE